MPQPNSLKKISSASVVQQVIDMLTAAMINKELRPGDKIPTENELAEATGVGRLSIREAIKVLVYYGVLEIRRPEGTFVRQGFSEYLIDPMLYGIILNNDDSYSQIKELRQLMEVGVIKLAAAKCTDEKKALLLEKYAQFEAALNEKPIDIEAVFEADNEFHRVLSEMGGNPMIDQINSLVRTLTHDIRHKTVENMIGCDDGSVLLQAHTQICDAIIHKKLDNLDEIVEGGYFYDRVPL